MASDISSSLKNWSTTESSNQPGNTTAISSNLDDNLRMIQKVVRDLAAPTTIASATTTDIGSKDETFITVSGTTTITGFGTVDSGIYKILIFSGALTLTHNATSLILPDGNNIVTHNGSVFLMLSLGSGNWRCLASNMVEALEGYSILAAASGFQGDWTTSTLYKVNALVRDSAGDFGAGTDAIISCVSEHTSATLASELTNWELFSVVADTPNINTSTSVTLTVNSPRNQVNRATSAATFTLPDATTLRTGGTPFIIDNQGTGTVTVDASGGTDIYYIPEGAKASFSLIDDSAAAGDWVELIGEACKLNVYPQSKFSYETGSGHGADKIDEGHILHVYSAGNRTELQVLEDRGVTFEPIQTLQVHATIGREVDVCVLGSTSALVMYTDANDYVFVEEISITANTYAIASAGTAVQLSSNTGQHRIRIKKLSSTEGVIAYTEGTSTYVNVATATAGTPTLGTARQVTSAATPQQPDIAILSTTVFLASNIVDSTTDALYVEKFTVSGGSATSGGSDSVTASGIDDYHRIYPMSSTTAILLYEEGNDPSYRWITASGTPSLGAENNINTAANGNGGMFLRSAAWGIEKIGSSSTLFLIHEQNKYHLVKLVDATSFTFIAQSKNNEIIVTESTQTDMPNLVLMEDGKLVAVGKAGGGTFTAAQVITSTVV